MAALVLLKGICQRNSVKLHVFAVIFIAWVAEQTYANNWLRACLDPPMANSVSGNQACACVHNFTQIKIYKNRTMCMHGFINLTKRICIFLHLCTQTFTRRTDLGVKDWRFTFRFRYYRSHSGWSQRDIKNHRAKNLVWILKGFCNISHIISIVPSLLPVLLILSPLLQYCLKLLLLVRLLM